MNAVDHYYNWDEGSAGLGLAPEQRGATAEFLLRCLLGARNEAELPSNSRCFDEDVNVYLVGLMRNFLSSSYHERAANYLHATDLDLARDLESNPDQRHRFRTYRTNADHLLLNIGLFCHVPGAANPRNPAFHRTPDAFIGRGGTYYQMASTSLRRLKRRDSGAEQALRTLGDHFGDYVTILRHVRSSYFHLLGRLGVGVLHHLLTGEPPEHRELSPEEVTVLYDEFLDAYGVWGQDRSFAARRALLKAIHRLREADPGFAFELPEEEGPPQGIYLN